MKGAQKRKMGNSFTRSDPGGSPPEKKSQKQTWSILPQTKKPELFPEEEGNVKDSVTADATTESTPIINDDVAKHFSGNVGSTAEARNKKTNCPGSPQGSKRQLPGTTFESLKAAKRTSPLSDSSSAIASKKNKNSQGLLDKPAFTGLSSVEALQTKQQFHETIFGNTVYEQKDYTNTWQSNHGSIAPIGLNKSAKSSALGDTHSVKSLLAPDISSKNDFQGLNSIKTGILDYDSKLSNSIYIHQKNATPVACQENCAQFSGNTSNNNHGKSSEEKLSIKYPTNISTATTPKSSTSELCATAVDSKLKRFGNLTLDESGRHPDAPKSLGPWGSLANINPLQSTKTHPNPRDNVTDLTKLVPTGTTMKNEGMKRGNQRICTPDISSAVKTSGQRWRSIMQPHLSAVVEKSAGNLPLVTGPETTIHNGIKIPDEMVTTKNNISVGQSKCHEKQTLKMPSKGTVNLDQHVTNKRTPGNGLPPIVRDGMLKTLLSFPEKAKPILHNKQMSNKGHGNEKRISSSASLTGSKQASVLLQSQIRPDVDGDNCSESARASREMSSEIKTETENGQTSEGKSNIQSFVKGTEKKTGETDAVHQKGHVEGIKTSINISGKSQDEPTRRKMKTVQCRDPTFREKSTGNECDGLNLDSKISHGTQRETTVEENCSESTKVSSATPLHKVIYQQCDEGNSMKLQKEVKNNSDPVPAPQIKTKSSLSHEFAIIQEGAKRELRTEKTFNHTLPVKESAEPDNVLMEHKAKLSAQNIQTLLNKNNSGNVFSISGDLKVAEPGGICGQPDPDHSDQDKTKRKRKKRRKKKAASESQSNDHLNSQSSPTDNFSIQTANESTEQLGEQQTEDHTTAHPSKSDESGNVATKTISLDPSNDCSVHTKESSVVPKTTKTCDTKSIRSNGLLQGNSNITISSSLKESKISDKERSAEKKHEKHGETISNKGIPKQETVKELILNTGSSDQVKPDKSTNIKSRGTPLVQNSPKLSPLEPIVEDLPDKVLENSQAAGPEKAIDRPNDTCSRKKHRSNVLTPHKEKTKRARLEQLGLLNESAGSKQPGTSNTSMPVLKLKGHNSKEATVSVPKVDGDNLIDVSKQKSGQRFQDSPSKMSPKNNLGDSNLKQQATASVQMITINDDEKKQMKISQRTPEKNPDLSSGLQDSPSKMSLKNNLGVSNLKQQATASVQMITINDDKKKQMKISQRTPDMNPDLSSENNKITKPIGSNAAEAASLQIIKKIHVTDQEPCKKTPNVSNSNVHQPRSAQSLIPDSNTRTDQTPKNVADKKSSTTVSKCSPSKSQPQDSKITNVRNGKTMNLPKKEWSRVSSPKQIKRRDGTARTEAPRQSPQKNKPSTPTKCTRVTSQHGSAHGSASLKPKRPIVSNCGQNGNVDTLTPKKNEGELANLSNTVTPRDQFKQALPELRNSVTIPIQNAKTFPCRPAEPPRRLLFADLFKKPQFSHSPINCTPKSSATGEGGSVGNDVNLNTQQLSSATSVEKQKKQSLQMLDKKPNPKQEDETSKDSLPNRSQSSELQSLVQNMRPTQCSAESNTLIDLSSQCPPGTDKLVSETAVYLDQDNNPSLLEDSSGAHQTGRGLSTQPTENRDEICANVKNFLQAFEDGKSLVNSGTNTVLPQTEPSKSSEPVTIGSSDIVLASEPSQPFNREPVPLPSDNKQIVSGDDSEGKVLFNMPISPAPRELDQDTCYPGEFPDSHNQVDVRLFLESKAEQMLVMQELTMEDFASKMSPEIVRIRAFNKRQRKKLRKQLGADFPLDIVDVKKEAELVVREMQDRRRAAARGVMTNILAVASEVRKCMGQQQHPSRSLIANFWS